MKYEKEHIHLLRMGGTIDFIDPAYDEINTKIIKINRTTEEYFKQIIQPFFTFSAESLCEKDSRDITEIDRKNCLNSIESSKSKKFLITHGTFTINTTAEFLKSNLKNTEKTVILTCSMIPLWGFMTTDASFNLGFACATLKFSEPGVFIVTNGERFDPEDIHKNLEQYKFELNA